MVDVDGPGDADLPPGVLAPADWARGVLRVDRRSYDCALAQAFYSRFKAELVRNKGLWKNIDDLEIAVAEYIDWSTTAAFTARSL